MRAAIAGAFHALRNFASANKAAVAPTELPRGGIGYGSRIFGYYGRRFELRPGDAQRRVYARPEDILSFPYAFAAVTAIAGDISKMSVTLKRRVGRIYEEAPENTPLTSAIAAVLRQPNGFQVFKKFLESWVYSILLTGNAFVLISRESAYSLHVLDPTRVSVRCDVAGGLWYDLRTDHLSGLKQNQIVPAENVIHHTINALYHPLCGVSPLDPASLSASQGLAILSQSTDFFANGAQPGGILSAEQPIPEADAERLREEWDQAFTGDNAGRIAVLGFGLKYQPLAMTGKDSQLAEQLNISGNMVCAALRFPLWKAGLQQIPTGHKPSELQQIYYADCLQTIIEDIEALLNRAFGLSTDYMVQFNTEDLLRMDAASQMTTIAAGVDANLLTINDARAKLDLRPLPHHDQLWMQMQDLPVDLALMLHQLQLERARAEAATSKPGQKNEDDEEEEFRAAADRFVRALRV